MFFSEIGLYLRLCRTERPDSSDITLNRARGVPKVNCLLGVEPELRRIAEQSRQPKRHLWADTATLAQQFIERLARNTNGRGQTGYRKAIVRQEILAQHLTWVSWPAPHLNGIRDAHMLHLGLVIVTDFYVICVAIDKPKANTPLIVDRNRVLALPVPFESVKPIARWNLQIIKPTCQVHILKLARGSLGHIRRKALCLAGHKQFLCPPVSK